MAKVTTQRAIQFGRKSPRWMHDRLKLARMAEWQPGRTQLWRYRNTLAIAWLEYVGTVSASDYAMSLETAAYLLWLCETREPKRLLDTGSGFSSFIFRKWAADHGATVVSLDDDIVWMARTAEYLARNHLSSEGLMEWKEFDPSAEARFDLIFHDMGNVLTRVSSMATIAATVSGAGVVVFDDMNLERVYQEARRITATAGREHIGLRSLTLDHPMRRYAGLSVPR